MVPRVSSAVRPAVGYVSYVGRFAPSPTGPLHEGSLLAAAASFLHARQAGGEWLLRIDDIDPPREVPGAASAIQHALEVLALRWDRSVLFQSTHFELYEAVALRLLAEGRAFRCRCSRSELRAYEAAHPEAPAYPGTCRNLAIQDADTTIRLRVDGIEAPPVDGLQGPIPKSTLERQGDFVIRRRDGLPAYHLATVVDDALQGITTIVRGSDLLESTAAQHHLQRALRLPTPAYFHIPVLVDATGTKLSKQTGAPPLDLADPSGSVERTLARLGAAPPPELRGAPPEELWQWALEKGVRALFRS